MFFFGTFESAQEQRRNSVKQVSKESLERLKRYSYRPGQSGNPGGRPAGRSITSALRNLLSKPYPGDKQRRTYAERIALALCKAAARGSVQAAALLADRVEGAVRSHVEIEIENRSHGVALSLGSFRTLSDAELDARLQKCNSILKRTKPRTIQ
jgi:hypothetical protein